MPTDNDIRTAARGLRSNGLTFAEIAAHLKCGPNTARPHGAQATGGPVPIRRLARRSHCRRTRSEPRDRVRRHGRFPPACVKT